MPKTYNLYIMEREKKQNAVAAELLFKLQQQNQNLETLSNFIRDNALCTIVIEMAQKQMTMEQLETIAKGLRLPLPIIYKNGCRSYYFLQNLKPDKIEINETTFIPIDLPQKLMSRKEAEAYCRSIHAHNFKGEECRLIVSEKREQINSILQKFGKTEISPQTDYWTTDAYIKVFSDTNQGSTEEPKKAHVMPVFCQA